MVRVFNLLKIVTGRPSYSNLYSILCKNKCKGDSLCLIITVSIVKITKRKVMIVIGKVVNVIGSM